MNVTVFHLSFKKYACNTDDYAYTSVFVLKGSTAEKSVCGSRFYSTLRRIYLLSDMLKQL